MGLILDSSVVIAGEWGGHTVRQIQEQFRNDYGESEIGVELRDAANPASATISGPDGDRTNVQMHIGPGCSEGCMLLTGGQQGRADFQSQINDLRAEDKANDNGTAIHIVIVDRNIQPVPSKLPDKLDERKEPN